MTNVEVLKNLAVAYKGSGTVDDIPGNTCAEVINYIATLVSGEVGELGELTVTLVEGTESGFTKITVTPELASGNSYAYKISPSDIEAPNYLDTISDSTVWDGTSEIEAEDGHEIGIYELDSNGRVVKFGMTTIHTLIV